MLLTAELAQQIVDGAMTIVRRNVNIMNERGIIIASGHKHRLGTFHKGANDVLEREEPVEIRPEQVANFPGALEGVNLPVRLHGRIIGVVGVFGDPIEVRDTASLVKTMAELILERESLCEQFRSESQLREHFLILLLTSGRAAPENVTAMAKLLRFRLDAPRLVVVLETSPALKGTLQTGSHWDSLLWSRARHQLVQVIEKSDLLTSLDFLSFFDDNLVLLKCFTLPCSIKKRQNWLDKLTNLLNREEFLPHIRVGVGGLASSSALYPQSHQEALFALRHTTANRLISDISDPNIMADFLFSHALETTGCLALDELRHNAASSILEKYSMSHTIEMLLACNLNLSLTAKRLFLHRNTLLYRLQKLKEVAGLDPVHSFQHAILCKMFFTR